MSQRGRIVGGGSTRGIVAVRGSAPGGRIVARGMAQGGGIFARGRATIITYGMARSIALPLAMRPPHTSPPAAADCHFGASARTSCLPPSLGVAASSPSPTCTAADCRFGSSSAQTVASPGVADDESNKWSGHLIAQDEACGFDASDRVGEGRGQPDDPPIDCRVWVGIFSTNFA